MRRTHDESQEQLGGQPQLKKFRLRKYGQGADDKVTTAVRAACYDANLATVELSREPIIVWCSISRPRCTRAIAYWPPNELLGRDVVYALRSAASGNGAKDLVWALVELAAGHLSDASAAKYPTYGKMKALLVREFLAPLHDGRGATLDALGCFTLVDGADCETLPPTVSKHANPVVDERDLASRLYIHCHIRGDGDGDSDDDDESDC